MPHRASRPVKNCGSPPAACRAEWRRLGRGDVADGRVGRLPAVRAATGAMTAGAAIYLSAGVAVLLSAGVAVAAGPTPLADYFRAEVATLRDRCRADTAEPGAWTARAGERRRQLFDMLGLDPTAVRTDLRAVVTGTLDHPDCIVERIHFQSRPGLYVTANLYLPRDRAGPVPAVLYLCGHARVVDVGVSLGNKTAYQHHGAWLARHGYAALLVDTLQLGEIEGIHHGTYREGRWWWPSRGYTPAGVEAWNAIRAVDYLQSRPEIDPDRIGVTGRSGGGAGSWWIAALDERIRAAVPVAGITDLADHVVAGVVSGHCDCMYLVNTYRWDYPLVAALVHPRPLLVANTDRDGIFPLEGVLATHDVVRRLYALDGRAADLGLVITTGGHEDTQELQLPALRWFDRHLRGEDRRIEASAGRLFEPARLRVFPALPADERNTTIDDSFVPAAGPFVPPASPTDWRPQADGWLAALRERTFAGWPDESGGRPAPRLTRLEQETHGDLVLETLRFESQPHVELDLFLLRRGGPDVPELVVLDVLDDDGWERFSRIRAGLPAVAGAAADGAPPGDAAAAPVSAGGLAPVSAGGLAQSVADMLAARPWAIAFLAPRGIGPSRWSREPREHVQIRRRFLLVGQTWEGMQCYDIRRALQTLRSIDTLAGVPVWIQAEGDMAVLAAYASLFEPPPARLDLHRVPASHQPDGPSLLNVLRILDVPQGLTLAADRGRVVLYDTDAAAFGYLTATAERLGWPEDRVQFRRSPPIEAPDR